MPEWWDLASAVANSALLEGMDDPSVACAFTMAAGSGDEAAFARILWARCVWATATNLYQARHGRGDAVWAQRSGTAYRGCMNAWYLSVAPKGNEDHAPRIRLCSCARISRLGHMGLRLTAWALSRAGV